MTLALTDHELDALERKLNAERARRMLTNYKAYPRQRDFHAAGAKHRERLLMTCNRFGKSVCGAAEMAFHLTGQYPAWEGRRIGLGCEICTLWAGPGRRSCPEAWCS
jgi:hypothetical protein